MKFFLPHHKRLMRTILKNFLSGGSVLVASLFAANFFNFLFNAYLGRTLSFEEFGLVTLVTTLWNLTNIPFGSLGSAVNHRVAFLLAHDGADAAHTFFRGVTKKTALIMTGLSVVWILITPWTAEYFHVHPSVLLLLTPAFFAGALSFIIRSYFAGIVAFGLAGMLIGADALTKLVLGVGLTVSPFSSYTYTAIPITACMTLLFSVILLRYKQQGVKHTGLKYRFPRRFFAASFLSGIASTAFLSFDVILAKHYLDTTGAGQYAFLSLVGKMVFFFGSLLNGFVITYVARDEGAGRDTNATFNRFLIGVTVLSIFAYTGVGLLGKITIPLLFGAKAFAITAYLPEYALAIALYTITGYIILFHLARKHYLFSVVAMLMAGALVVGLTLSHETIGNFTHVLFIVSIINFFITALLHFLQRNGEFMLRNLIDLLDVFSPLPIPKTKKKGTKRILIMNWRDTKHLYAGGAEVYIHELAKRWVKKGHKVTIFCGNDSKSTRNDVIDGIQIIRRGGFYFVYFWGFIYYLTKFRGQYDVIIDCQNGIPFFTPLYVKERVICVVHHIHQEVFRTHLSPPLSLIARVLENRLMPSVYRKVQFVAVSPSTKQEMNYWGMTGTGISIINNGIDDTIYTPRVKSKIPTVLYVGRLKYYKSLNIFIKAAGLVHKTNPKVRFIIAGDGEERKGLLKLVKKMKAESYIEFTGKVTEEAKIELFQKAWVFVNPSKMEGWGITTIEANACATPVIASKVPGLSDSVVDGKSGILVPYGNVAGFAKAITHLLTDHKQRKAMERYAVTWAKKFRWDESARQFTEIMTHTVVPTAAANQSIPIHTINLPTL